ncbi:MAG TPA: hypothetical protein VK992_00530 [Candidatus Caenarcaniphilales bacterium]|nr:hypothetical protein [Candidatus Caenarcaniphilales bacterium]
MFDLFEGAPNDSAILDVTLDAAGVVSLNWLPTLIVNGIPRPAPESDVERILRRIPDLSPTPTPTPSATPTRTA